jgi:hypothetical protein
MHCDHKEHSRRPSLHRLNDTMAMYDSSHLAVNERRTSAWMRNFCSRFRKISRRPERMRVLTVVFFGSGGAGSMAPWSRLPVSSRDRLKSGLNRSILDASPFELRRQLEYKTQWNGGLLVPVSPQNTSRKCPKCQHTSAENCKTQTKFVCVECGFRAHADWVGAVNIKEAGLASLARSPSSHARNASCQEPTEGIVCASMYSLSESPSVHGGEDVNECVLSLFHVRCCA